MFFKEKRVNHKWAFNEMVLLKNTNAGLNKPFFYQPLRKRANNSKMKYIINTQRGSQNRHMRLQSKQAVVQTSGLILLRGMGMVGFLASNVNLHYLHH